MFVHVGWVSYPTCTVTVTGTVQAFTHHYQLYIKTSLIPKPNFPLIIYIMDGKTVSEKKARYTLQARESVYFWIFACL